MSTPQRTRARVLLVVDRTTADVLRLEAKKILMFNHELFEDYLDLSPDAQYELAMRFQDATDLITTVGWAGTNRDRLECIEDNEPIPADLMAEITADRNAATELDRVIAAYTVAIASDRG
jgi:hypothetical protein